MITNNLYNTVLVNPATHLEQSELFIVSGYASATFLRRHITELLNNGLVFKINLIVGMPSRRNDHRAFIQLHDEFPELFTGYYYTGGVPVHSKVYSWYSGDTAIAGFSGSANYSQYGFFSDKQINQISVEEPLIIKSFFDSLVPNSQLMTEAYVEDLVIEEFPEIAGDVSAGNILWVEPNKSVRISFLARDGSLPTKSGLNWGQRLSKNTNRTTGEITYSQREPDQAYLSIKQSARDEGFLPEKGFTFTMITDDNVTMDCVVAQQGRKGVQTTNDNSELGRYIRQRIGVPNGTLLTREHLEEYGRTDFTLVKIDEETFLFDFSV